MNPCIELPPLIVERHCVKNGQGMAILKRSGL